MEGPSRGWDINEVFEEVEMHAQRAGVNVNTTQADLVEKPAAHGRLVKALKGIAKYRQAKGRRDEETSETPEDDRSENSTMLVESLWDLATNCLAKRIDEKHMQLEAGREMSREARRRRDLFEGYAAGSGRVRGSPTWPTTR